MMSALYLLAVNRQTHPSSRGYAVDDHIDSYNHIIELTDSEANEITQAIFNKHDEYLDETYKACAQYGSDYEEHTVGIGWLRFEYYSQLSADDESTITAQQAITLVNNFQIWG